MDKVLVANRGEIACRVIRTLKKMGIKSVAIYSEADRDALHVKMADEAYYIGAAPSAESYLRQDKIIQICIDHQVDGVHPGYGFLSENSGFALKLQEKQIKLIGPSAYSMDIMGDKLSAKAAVKDFNIPMVPGTDYAISDIDEARNIARNVGYPVLVKASAGGGGKGMRVVWSEEEIERAFDNAKAEAAASFKNDGIYMEKFVEEPRHIEIQVAGDQYGNFCHMSERDCSIQRRHQKLVEESPSPFMTPELRKAMGEAAIKAAAAINYESVGTIEFLVDKHRNFYFMEMNTRIQVEHCVTEEVINYDLIKEQIKIAMGDRISGKSYYPQMHAIECRINAEDPYNDFRPSPGKITVLNQPGGHGIRIDSHVYAGYTIPPYYDSMIGKIIATARTRNEAIDTMHRALTEYVIEGVKTTIPFHLQLMKDERFRSGDFNTKFLESFTLL